MTIIKEEKLQWLLSFLRKNLKVVVLILCKISHNLLMTFIIHLLKNSKEEFFIYRQYLGFRFSWYAINKQTQQRNYVFILCH